MKTKGLKKFIYNLLALFNRFYVSTLIITSVAILTIGTIKVLWPSFQEVQAQGALTLTHAEEKEQALKQHLENVRNTKIAYENFSKQQISKLRAILPHKADLAGLFAQAQELAERNGLLLMSVDIIQPNTFGAPEENGVVDAAQAAQDSITAGIEELDVSMIIRSGDYGKLKQFLSEIEQNLRLFNITSINFGAVEDGPYTVNLKTYYFP